MTSLVYLTDKNNCKMFKNIVGKGCEQPAVRELERHLLNAKKNPKMYNFLDLETAKIIIEYDKDTV